MHKKHYGPLDKYTLVPSAVGAIQRHCTSQRVVLRTVIANIRHICSTQNDNNPENPSKFNKHTEYNII